MYEPPIEGTANRLMSYVLDNRNMGTTALNWQQWLAKMTSGLGNTDNEVEFNTMFANKRPKRKLMSISMVMSDVVVETMPGCNTCNWCSYLQYLIYFFLDNNFGQSKCIDVWLLFLSLSSQYCVFITCYQPGSNYFCLTAGPIFLRMLQTHTHTKKAGLIWLLSQSQKKLKT